MHDKESVLTCNTAGSTRRS